MKHFILTVSLFLTLLSPAGAQEIWDPNTSPTATSKSYGGILFDLKNAREGGRVFSIGLEYGRILNRNICLGITGRYMGYGTSSDPGTAFCAHPYARITTSMPHLIPNLFADIGYDFRRRAYNNVSTAPTVSHEIGIRPGLVINVADWFFLFIQFSFSGYQWCRTGDAATSSWTSFRHDYQDRCAGLYFYF